MIEKLLQQATQLPNYIKLLFAVLLAMNAIGFVLMGIDKKKAKKHRRRIPEWTLLTFAVLGGGFGVLLGMAVFHHKTNNVRHPSFTKGVPIVLLTELLVALILVAMKTK